MFDDSCVEFWTLWLPDGCVGLWVFATLLMLTVMLCLQILDLLILNDVILLYLDHNQRLATLIERYKTMTPYLVRWNSVFILGKLVGI